MFLFCEAFVLLIPFFFYCNKRELIVWLSCQGFAAGLMLSISFLDLAHNAMNSIGFLKGNLWVRQLLMRLLTDIRLMWTWNLIVYLFSFSPFSWFVYTYHFCSSLQELFCLPLLSISSQSQPLFQMLTKERNKFECYSFL